MPTILNLNLDALPSDQAERELMLHRYFQRQDIQVSKSELGWNVKTAWTNNPSYYIDDKLNSGLRCWHQPLSVFDIPLAVKQENGFLLALNDCWSLLSWSALLDGSGDKFNKLNLIHLDSHTDLNSPRLRLTGEDGWVDMLSGEPFSFGDPMSVVGAIKSGAIGIGSFICPLIASGNDVNVYHLSNESQFRYPPDQYSLTLDLERGDPIFESAIRPALRVGQSTSNSSYTLSNSLSDLCKAVDIRYPTLLHIDLDYFNNRFDGAPNWRERSERHDPSTDNVLDSIDAVFDELSTQPFKIEDVSVGISPGFFPASLWQPAINKLRSKVSNLWR